MSSSDSDEAVKSSKLKESLEKLSIPAEIYEKALAEIFKPELKAVDKRVPLMCHNTLQSRFNSPKPPNCQGYFMEAAKQALEDRNFRVLYEIISKAMELRDSGLTQQMHEYMFAAITHDPTILNKEQTIDKFLTRVKFIEKAEDKEAYLKSAHTLRIVKLEDPVPESPDDPENPISKDESGENSDISEGSIDLSVFQSIKNELW